MGFLLIKNISLRYDLVLHSMCQYILIICELKPSVSVAAVPLPALAAGFVSGGVRPVGPASIAGEETRRRDSPPGAPVELGESQRVPPALRWSREAVSRWPTGKMR